ncbi:MAG: hypothetical protein KDI39_00300 [Pseudomonadales bacterium]|nr:hypothetical protein [Pseudomonadales bacterium]
MQVTNLKLNYSNLDNKPRIIIHCQYVYGIGHFVRAVELARFLIKSFNVFLLNGGEPIMNYTVPDEVFYFQMPSIYKDENSNQLIPVDSSLELKKCFVMRSAIIEQLVDEICPDILITEHFPFGLLFETEVIKLIKQIKRNNPNSKIVSSVRDVIESENGSEKDAFICALLNKWYDAVLVHSDELIIPFKASFPMTDQIKVPLHHTGYVVQRISPSKLENGLPILLVSIGGGRMGNELLYAMIDAHKLINSHWPHKLVLFIGAFQRDDQMLQSVVNKNNMINIMLLPFDKDAYLQNLAKASAVVCMGGYNSVLEALSTGVPVLIYNRKFLGNNKEQELRSAIFQKLCLVDSFGEEDLAQEKLAHKIIDIIKNKNRYYRSIKLNGAEVTCQILQELIHRTSL